MDVPTVHPVIIAIKTALSALACTHGGTDFNDHDGCQLQRMSQMIDQSRFASPFVQWGSYSVNLDRS